MVLARPCPRLDANVVEELFYGSGHFAREMEEHQPVLRWDILIGPAYDLT